MKKFVFCLLLSQILLTLSCSTESRVVTFNNTEPIDPANRVAFRIGMTSDGTLSAAQNDLCLLDSIGADILWLKVNSAFDTIKGLRDYVSAAHELGMQVWVDWDAAKNSQQSAQDTTQTEVMKHHMKSLVRDTDIDGLCFDYTASPSIPMQFWHDIIRQLKDQKPEMEFLSKADISDSINHNLTPCSFDFDCASNFQQQLAQRFGREQTQADSLRTICEQLISASSTVMNYRMVNIAATDKPDTTPSNTLETLYGDNRYNMVVLLFTLYGIPVISQEQVKQSDIMMQNTIQTLIALHHTQPALALDAPINFLPTSDPQVLAYKRGAVVVVLNLGNVEAHANVIDIDTGQYDKWIDSKNLPNVPSISRVELSSSQSIALDAHGFAVYVACGDKTL